MLMAGAFGLTLAVLGGTFMALQSLAREPERPLRTATPSLVALPSIAPTPFQTRHPAGTPRPLTTRPPTPTRKPAPTPSDGRPAATPAPTTAPSVTAGGTITVVVPGDQYELADVPENGTVTPLPGGAVRLETTRIISAQLMVTWFVPEGSVPEGTTITGVDVAVCGSGDGDFYETYGPEGSDPMEHEVEPPDADGCWHYNDAIGDDTSVIAITRLASHLIIERVEYTLHVQ